MGYLDAGGGRRAPASPVYLDHAATTPMLPEAIEAMTEELAELGNPSSLHNPGRRARQVVEESRGRGGVAGADRGRVRPPSQRGDLHKRRDRGGKPGC